MMKRTRHFWATICGSAAVSSWSTGIVAPYAATLSGLEVWVLVVAIGALLLSAALLAG